MKIIFLIFFSPLQFINHVKKIRKNPETNKKTYETGKTAFLILDGAKSHVISTKMAEKLKKLDIVLISLPTNTSHILQPLFALFF